MEDVMTDQGRSRPSTEASTMRVTSPEGYTTIESVPSADAGLPREIVDLLDRVAAQAEPSPPEAGEVLEPAPTDADPPAELPSPDDASESS